jgi:hypothetical protein
MQTATTLEAEWRQVLQRSMSTGAKEDGSSTGYVWAAGFHHVTARSHLAGILKIKNCLFLYFPIFLGHGELWIPETTITESVDTGAHLYYSMYALMLLQIAMLRERLITHITHIRTSSSM